MGRYPQSALSAVKFLIKCEIIVSVGTAGFHINIKLFFTAVGCNINTVIKRYSIFLPRINGYKLFAELQIYIILAGFALFASYKLKTLFAWSGSLSSNWAAFRKRIIIIFKIHRYGLPTVNIPFSINYHRFIGYGCTCKLLSVCRIGIPSVEGVAFSCGSGYNKRFADSTYFIACVSTVTVIKSNVNLFVGKLFDRDIVKINCCIRLICNTAVDLENNILRNLCSVFENYCALLPTVWRRAGRKLIIACIYRLKINPTIVGIRCLNGFHYHSTGVAVAGFIIECYCISFTRICFPTVRIYSIPQKYIRTESLRRIHKEWSKATAYTIGIKDDFFAVVYLTLFVYKWCQVKCIILLCNLGNSLGIRGFKINNINIRH